MSAARPVIVDLDRSYDLRVLGALPSTLAMFAASDLELQLGQMAKQRRAICFTLMAPVHERGAGRGGADCSIATVLVCLHVAPELAARGLDQLLATLKRTAKSDADPAHELAAPLTQPDDARRVGFYREAVYGEDDAYIAITTHTPAEIPAELADTVAAATKGVAIDILTTVAVTPHRPLTAKAPHRRPAASRTLH
jgi:hypothetical protein